MEQDQYSSPSQSTNPNTTNSLFKDISNFKTPKSQQQQIPNFNFKTPKPSPIPQFFTASKQTPTSNFRRRSSILPTSTTRSKAARRLKAFELEQSQSSRKAQVYKEKSVKSLSKSLSVWLNFLFENPKACGCDVLDGVEEGRDNGLGNGKRDSWDEGRGVGINGPWRCPKRQRDSSWRPEGVDDLEPLVLSSSVVSSLRGSLQEVCSFDDLKQRMRGYLSADGCKEALLVMSKVTKNIDDGRLRMRAHCPIITDVRLREQAIHVLMCYNPMWLRIGLYIVLGGDSLVPTGDVNSEREVAFLKMIVEKQLFSHPDLAKRYAYNKSVEGLYRPGYYEALGNVILKRFLLLVLILDRAKSQSSLPIKYGIDGIDGGSPLLFERQLNIKSSRQVIHEFLSSEIMRGEGDLLAHLVIVGYKVSYQQHPLLDYDFTVNDLFHDLQDGVRLCRAIQLLKCDTSILTKLVIPADTRKKNLVNCGIALQYLKQAGVPLHDEDGFTVVAEDVASGDKELTLSMLWNMFVHLQLPLLVNETQLFEEIRKINGADTDCMESSSANLLGMILQWIQAICMKYDLKVANYGSLLDGKAMRCLIDYYCRHELHCSSFCKAQMTDCEDHNNWSTEWSDAVHNFIISQKLTTMLGGFPEVLETSEILEHNGACNERSAITLLIFLSSQLIGRRTMDHVNIHKLLGCNCPTPEVKRLSLHKCFLSSDAPAKNDGLDLYNNEDAVRKFKAIQAWWRDMAKHHRKCDTKETYPAKSHPARRNSSETERESALKIIQSHVRGSVARRKFLNIKTAASFLQMAIRAWLTVNTNPLYFECQKYPDTYFGRHLTFMVERHSFVALRKSALIIQQAVRTWIHKKRHINFKSNSENLSVPENDQIEQVAEKDDAKKIQMSTIVTVILVWRKWRKFINQRHIAATKIQSYWHGLLTRRMFLHQKKAIVMIQTAFRSYKCWKDFQQFRIANRSAIIIQSHFRRLRCCKETKREKHLIVFIQSQWRGSLLRKDYLCQREAAKVIQSGFRGLKIRKEFRSYKLAAIEIQRFAKGLSARNRLLGASLYRSSSCRGSVINLELKIFLYSLKKLQRWWKGVLLLKSKTKAAIIIQSHIRVWIARKEASREKHRITVIQSYWKGYLARKESKGQILEVRKRVQRSCSNVDDGMRLINRLVSALSELLNVRSISSILHTCSTLDMATTHSQRCAETLVAAGAVETLLKVIRSLSRSVPDQEVLKHSLSTLKNISRYPHLADVLIDTKGSIETILREMLRNKDEGYFIASEILRKLCLTKKGVEVAWKSPALVKRLHSQVGELTRKVAAEKRKPRIVSGKEYNEKRLREASELLKLISC
ncbi:hypothetical protein ACHQM5_003602 [Ranunculus cassubicifolius]